MSIKMGRRWYGTGNDPVTLQDIKQIPGVTSIVWALHKKMPGEIWEEKEIKEVVSNEINDDNKKTKTKMTKKEKELMLNNIETQMKEAAKNLDFERAMELRDILFELKSN